jgi:Sulfotransferase family
MIGGVEGPRYLLVASSSYSGSTLLAMLLNGHPDVAAVGETSTSRRESRMDEFLCSCGRLMEECPFWIDVADRMHRAGYTDFRLANFELGFDPAGHGIVDRLAYGSLRVEVLERIRDAIVWRLPGHRERLRAIGLRNRAFAEAVLAATGARVMVDTSKERMRARDLHRWLGMDLRVVHLVRDPRGVVDSALRRGRDGGDERRAAERWAKVNDAILRASARLPGDRRLVVRYEALCADPVRELERIVAFAGLDPHLLDPGAAPARSHVLGNRARLRPLGEIRLDERWRDALTDEALGRIAARTAATEGRIASAEGRGAEPAR